jgi:hypothetical protein
MHSYLDEYSSVYSMQAVSMPLAMHPCALAGWPAPAVTVSRLSDGCAGVLVTQFILSSPLKAHEKRTKTDNFVTKKAIHKQPN